MAGEQMASIRPALPEEAGVISGVALRSKAHWGYSVGQMAVFGPELTLSPGEIEARRVHVFEEDGRIVGFFTLVARDEGVGELEHIFVDPSRLGRGIGAALFRRACVVAQEAGWRRLVIQSDPNAAGFYQRMGARLERHVPSSIPGRNLPLFTFALPALRRVEARLD
jgi:GNAT superfamily N-acetyltransferase